MHMISINHDINACMHGDGIVHSYIYVCRHRAGPKSGHSALVMIMTLYFANSCTCACARLHTYMYICIYAYTYAYACAYTRTYKYTCIRIQLQHAMIMHMHYSRRHTMNKQFNVMLLTEPRGDNALWSHDHAVYSGDNAF